MRTSEISWKIIIYTDLTNILGATTGLQRELSMAIRQCDNISDICKSQNPLVRLGTKINKMLQYQRHISELVGRSRIKRALEFIGQISKILFGTITTEDAYYINEAIVRENKTNDSLHYLLIKH